MVNGYDLKRRGIIVPMENKKCTTTGRTPITACVYCILTHMLVNHKTTQYRRKSRVWNATIF